MKGMKGVGRHHHHRRKYEKPRHPPGSRPKGVIEKQGPSPRRKDGKRIRRGNRVSKFTRAKA